MRSFFFLYFIAATINCHATDKTSPLLDMIPKEHTIITRNNLKLEDLRQKYKGDLSTETSVLVNTKALNISVTKNGSKIDQIEVTLNPYGKEIPAEGNLVKTYLKKISETELHLGVTTAHRTYHLKNAEKDVDVILFFFDDLKTVRIKKIIFKKGYYN